MSTLSSTSTDEQVWAAYDDNASFEEDGSTSKAAAFVTACRILLRRRPASYGTGGETVAFDGASIVEQLQRAQKWLAANRASSGPQYLDFRGLRD